MSTSEAAQILGVNQSTILRSLREMKLPGLKIGRRWHIRRAEIEALVEENDSEEESQSREESTG